jgi:hypothetical protein
VRLDHLLSKEHVPACVVWVGVLWVEHRLVGAAGAGVGEYVLLVAVVCLLLWGWVVVVGGVGSADAGGGGVWRVVGF